MVLKVVPRGVLTWCKAHKLEILSPNLATRNSITSSCSSISTSPFPQRLGTSSVPAEAHTYYSLAFDGSRPGIRISLISPAASLRKKLILSAPRCLHTMLNWILQTKQSKKSVSNSKSCARFKEAGDTHEFSLIMYAIPQP